MPPRREPYDVNVPPATFFICVSGAMVVELGYGVLVSYVGKSSNETDFEHVIGACVFFVVEWSEFRLQ